MADWMFFANYAPVGVRIITDPRIRLCDVACEVVEAERVMPPVAADLVESGCLQCLREGCHEPHSLRNDGALRYPEQSYWFGITFAVLRHPASTLGAAS